MSANAEEKKTRTNLKNWDVCLKHLSALFLDFNKISIEDEGDWFKNVFVTGPGFVLKYLLKIYLTNTLIGCHYLHNIITKIFFKLNYKSISSNAYTVR